jgi:hypothetical protein
MGTETDHVQHCLILIVPRVSEASTVLFSFSCAFETQLTFYQVLLVNTVTLIMCMSLISTNIAGFTKKATASTMFFVAYCIGQIITPQFFRSSQSPTYTMGFRAFFCTVALMLVVQILLA